MLTIQHFPIHGTPDLAPSVAVIMINSRQFSHPHYVKAAKESVQLQFKAGYNALGLVEVLNLANSHTIGACWNMAVRRCKELGYQYVTFLGDDDRIAPDFIMVMLATYVRENIIGQKPIVSCFCKPCDSAQRPIPSAYMEQPYTGFFATQFLIDNPYDETLKSGVDHEHLMRLVAKGTPTVCVPYYFGYYYTMHGQQVSGMKKGKRIG